MSFRTPLKKANSLGSAKSGYKHWIQQRVTAVALAVLTIYFLYLLVRLSACDYLAARYLLAEPMNAAVMFAFVVATFWHASLGMQVVIEDYIHHKGMEWSLILFTRFACFFAATYSAIALGRLVFNF